MRLQSACLALRRAVLESTDAIRFGGITEQRTRLPSGLGTFITTHRAKLTFASSGVRIVYRSTLVADASGQRLAAYIADRAPEFYRPISDVIRELEGGHSLSVFKETLARLPTAESFQSSHFAEIAASLFAEEILGLRRIYSKLSTLTSENANGNKMDLLLYDPQPDPIEFVFGEVKSSDKMPGHEPACHDKSCYPSLFNSLREYTEDDLAFDLAAIKDRLSNVPEADRSRIRDALKPYTLRTVRYAGFIIIDDGTFSSDEAAMLASRTSDKRFDVDLVGLDGYSVTAKSAFERLHKVLDALRSACS
jgi:hypothetical protein